MKSKDEEALKAMVALEGHQRDILIVTQDFEDIKASIIIEHIPNVKTNTRPGLRLILGVGVQTMQQLTGKSRLRSHYYRIRALLEVARHVSRAIYFEIVSQGAFIDSEKRC